MEDLTKCERLCCEMPKMAPAVWKLKNSENTLCYQKSFWVYSRLLLGATIAPNLVS